MNLKNILLCLNYRGPKGNVFQFFLATCLICMLMLTMSSHYSSTRTLRAMRQATVPLVERSMSPIMEETVRILKLKGLAMNLTWNIERLSNPDSCENISTLLCGHSRGCGLGCQLHHRAACLMLSYSMSIPLIHDSSTWAYGKWEDTFQPLGSSCPVNERTLIMRWKHKGGPVPYLNKSLGEASSSPYPFQSGIPVDPDFLGAINESHPEPFLWYVGQFLKHTMRRSWKLGPVVEDFLSELPHNSPMVGLHVRRTDKCKTANDSFHEIQDYMIPAQAYFQRINFNLNRTVYLASDDNKLLSQAKDLYPPPKWRLIGLDMNVTFRSQKSRHNNQALISIIKDVLALSKCHYVVCGFSSNICRLILELQSADHLDGFQRVTSLDWQYNYKILGHSIKRRLIPMGIEKHA